MLFNKGQSELHLGCPEHRMCTGRMFLEDKRFSLSWRGNGKAEGAMQTAKVTESSNVNLCSWINQKA